MLSLPDVEIQYLLDNATAGDWYLQSAADDAMALLSTACAPLAAGVPDPEDDGSGWLIAESIQHGGDARLLAYARLALEEVLRLRAALAAERASDPLVEAVERVAALRGPSPVRRDDGSVVTWRELHVALLRGDEDARKLRKDIYEAAAGLVLRKS